MTKKAIKKDRVHSRNVPYCEHAHRRFGCSRYSARSVGGHLCRRNPQESFGCARGRLVPPKLHQRVRGTVHAVITGSMQANCQAYFRFSGVSSHAAGAPHLGRSALDAVELMDVGANYLREHMETTDRIHYAITDTGGKSPNVVQNHA